MAAFRSTTVRYWTAGLRIVTILFLALSAFGPANVTPVFADQLVCGIPGNDGPVSTLSGVVNTYYPGTANVTAGSTSIPVGSPAGAATPIQAGDLLLVIQMQGADINSTNTGAYGDGAAGDPAAGNLGGATFSAGRYEYVVATSGAAGGNVSISTGLANDYFDQDYPVGATNQGQRRYQVIRVPQYSSATMTGTVTALAWNGSVGGVVVLDVAGTLNFGGNTIDVSGRGFRGGGGVRYRGGTGVSTDYRTLSTNTANASKGEGTAGTPRFIYTGATVIDQGVNLEGYPNGSFARGAPGNAGGGGTDGNPPANDQNTGGGGGGNGGVGGHGGTAWDNAPADSGGFGGAAFPAGTSRLVLGGGGGAGTIDDNAGVDSSGAAGGGIAIVIAGTITGDGSINANGLNATGQILNDSGGGGGAGGSVVVVAHTAALPAGLNISANGGRGGNAWPGEPPGPDYPGTRHGPGGGGGGGVIFHSNGAAVLSVAGGQNGITTTANDNYLATPGALGITRNLGGDPPSFPNCVPVPSVVKTTSTPLRTQTPTGTSGEYTIVASVPADQGTALGFTISDILPDGFTYASTTAVNLSGGATRPITSNPTAGTSSPAWGTFNIPGGGAVAITFTVNIASTVPAGTYQNPATATYLDPTRTETGGTATTEYDITNPGEDITVVVLLPDLTVTKTNNVNGTVAQGSPFNWTITVANAGGAPATFASGQVVMSDALPGAASYYPQGDLTVNPPGAIICTIDNTALACTANGIYSLAAGASFSVTFQVTPTAAGDLINTAVADPGEIMPESNENNNTASNTVTVTPIVTEADLSINKTNGQTSYVPGNVVIYTVTVTNLSGVTANGAIVTDARPTNITTWAWACTTQSGAATGCDPAANSANNFTDTVNLPVGGTIVYTVTANVSANATGNLVNTAEVATPPGLTDPNPDNNTSTDTDLPPDTADLSINKTNGQTSYVPGSVVTYTVTVTNLSGATANGATVTDNKPANVTTWAWACTTQSGGATGCDPAANSVNNFTDTVNLPVGGTIVYTVTANTLASATTNLVNTANVDVPPGLTDPNPDNNTSTDNDPPAPPNTVDLSATKDNGQTTFAAGQEVIYTVTVRNNSGVTATGAVVSDPRPANISTWTWTCTMSGGATGCNGAASSSNDFTDTVNLPVGGSIVYTVTANVVATPTGSTLENTVTVDPPSGYTDTNPTNNSATDIDGLGPSADLELIKAPETKQVEIGDTLTFTLTLTNLGPDDAFDVEVTDKLPSAFTYISSKPSKGTYDPVTGVWTVGDMPVDAKETLEITVKVNGAGTNVAEVTQSLVAPNGPPLIDPNPGNNFDESKITIKKDDDDDKKKSNPFLIPVTGFQPGVITDLSKVRHETYLATADVTVEIPSLGVKIPIVGVPKKDGTWNVAWLGNEAGWLEGSAFPSWNGNSVLTSHVYLASGKPGPFYNLNKLKFGDKIVVHAYGQKYTFEVQTNTVVAPTETSTMMKHEEKPWLTLVTCKDYDPKTNTYLNRILVRARLVSVDWE